MAHVVRELVLHKNCKGCNTTVDLYAINCGHMTLCFLCAKVLFLTGAPCPHCIVSIKQLIQDCKVSAHKQQSKRGVQQATKYMLYMKGLQFLTSPAPNWYPFEIRVPRLKKPPTLQEAQEHLSRNGRNPTVTTPSAQVNPVRSCKECGTEMGLHSTTCYHLTLCFQCANVMFLTAAPCPQCLVPVTQLVDEWDEPDGEKKAQYYTLCEGGYRLEYSDDLGTTPSAGADASKDEPECSNMKSKLQAMVLSQKAEEDAPMKKGAVKRSAPDPSSKPKGVVKRSVKPVVISRDDVVSDMEGAPVKKGVVKRSVPSAPSKPKVVVKRSIPNSKPKVVVKRSIPNSKPKGVVKRSIPNSEPKGVEKRSVPVAILEIQGYLNLEAEKKATRLACGLSESP